MWTEKTLYDLGMKRKRTRSDYITQEGMIDKIRNSLLKGSLHNSYLFYRDYSDPAFLNTFFIRKGVKSVVKITIPTRAE